VEEGRIPAERIQASLERVWRAKQKTTTFGVDSESHQHAWEQQMPSPIRLEAIAQPDALEAVGDILRASNLGRGAIAAMPEPGRTVIVVDSMLDCDFLHRQAPAVALFQAWGYEIQIVDAFGLEVALAHDRRADWPTVLQLFVRGNPYRGSAGLNQAVQDWFDFLVMRDRLQALVIYGSPYVLDDFLPQLPEGIPYGFSYGQMPMAQRLLLEKLIP
jgi:beta-glucosidase